MQSSELQTKMEKIALQWEVEQFLYHEATLLDYRKWDEWLDLLAEDIRYYMPIMRNVKFGEFERELTKEQEDINWFDEGKTTLRQRIEQLKSGMHWAEEPLSRTRHLVTNVRITDVIDPEVHVTSHFLIYRNRVETETDIFVGDRHDVLRNEEGAWKLARRQILLAQNVLLAKNLTILF